MSEKRGLEFTDDGGDGRLIITSYRPMRRHLKCAVNSMS